MASGLGRIPLNLEKGNYGQAALSVAMPLGVGALAGVGAENTGQFVNNLVNPLAGIKLKANLPEGTVINGVSLNPFKGKIDKKIELIPVPSKFRGEDAYNIKYGDKFIGDFDFEKINDRYVPFSISIDKEYRGQGLGKEAYEVANKLLKSQGKGSLHSSGFFIGDNAKHVWRSLEKTGKAEKIGEDSWKFLKFGGTVKVLDTKIEKNKKYYLINE
jgi:GNAT superfamily N-acetyltransferase